uniref:Seminal fluid protein CSSFP064 n=1 Tax=Chilo suppressalis TaxID=168631 RepID=G9F9L4_CHISP|nr:seminal fluid protein CSSFP064 [Chilo suppressalis]
MPRPNLKWRMPQPQSLKSPTLLLQSPK